MGRDPYGRGRANHGPCAKRDRREALHQPSTRAVGPLAREVRGEASERGEGSENQAKGQEGQADC